MENMLGNTLQTCGTYWEPRKSEKKIPPPPPPPNLKGKLEMHLECIGPSHWLHEISLPKRVHHHFWGGLIPLEMNTLPIILFHIN
jgi:hypothetical protein